MGWGCSGDRRSSRSISSDLTKPIAIKIGPGPRLASSNTDHLVTHQSQRNPAAAVVAAACETGPNSDRKQRMVGREPADGRTGTCGWSDGNLRMVGLKPADGRTGACGW